jgi:hypothetical protein
MGLRPHAAAEKTVLVTRRLQRRGKRGARARASFFSGDAEKKMPDVCEIEIRSMRPETLATLRARIVGAAKDGRPLLFDLRGADPSCLQYTTGFVSMIRDEADALASARTIAIVAKDEWVRVALKTAMALTPRVAEHIVTRHYAKARAFCAGGQTVA